MVLVKFLMIAFVFQNQFNWKYHNNLTKKTKQMCINLIRIEIIAYFQLQQGKLDVTLF